MKRFFIATMTTVLLLLSGCRKEENSTVDIPIHTLDEFVRIELGANSNLNNTTRASLESLDDISNDPIGSIGVFCLANRRTHVAGSSEAKDIDWSTIVSTDKEEYGYTTNGTYWNNVRCRVENHSSGFKLIPDDEQEFYWYYPNTSWYGYDFYGYYPYNAGRPTIESNKVTIDMEIDGTQDVIWGQSVDPRPSIYSMIEDQSIRNKLVDSYYSAHFFRFAPESWTAAQMKFHHKLTQFRFYVYPAANKDASPEKKYDAATSLKVTELRLENEKYNLQMVLADRSGQNQGEVYSRDDNTRDFHLCHRDGTLLEDSAVNIVTKTNESGEIIPDTIRLGESIMALPGKSVYYISVMLADNVTSYSSEKLIAIRRGNGEPFESGKIYHVYLQVAGVTSIGVTAELEDWVDNQEQVGNIEFQ